MRKRSTRGTRGKSRKTRRVMRRKRVVKPMTLAVKRKFWFFNWAPQVATVAGYWRYWDFNINSMPDVAQYRVLFDEYRINAIKVEFHPRFTEFAGNDVTTSNTQRGVTRMSLINDPTSHVVPSGVYGPATYNTFLEQGNARTFNGTRPFSIYIRPKVNDALGSITSAKRIRPGYLSLDNAGTLNHNGFHAFIWDDNFSNTFTSSFDVLVTYYVTFRGMK